jgi:phosphoribosylamine-glycine ligase
MARQPNSCPPRKITSVRSTMINDQGLNTGGMGAYAPAPCVTPALQKEIEDM